VSFPDFCDYRQFYVVIVLLLLRPVVQAEGYRITFFFTFFSSPIFVSFAEKANPPCLQLYPFFLLFLVTPHSTILGIRTYISSDMAPNMSSPPHPRPPEAAVCLAIPVDGLVNYILPV